MSLDDLQFKGSHNSYHRAPLISLMRQWNYTNAPLEVQLEHQGVRQLELDVRYEAGALKVSHLPWVDGRSSCDTLKACLGRIKRWSKQHPLHLPVFVFIEAKEALVPSGLDGKIGVIDAEIGQVLPRSSLLTPEDVLVPGLSLRDSVLARGWPRVADVRGRIAFVLFGPERHRAAYTRGSRTLSGRLMFVATTPDKPEASVLMLDDPIREFEQIGRAVRAGFLVRTRADEGRIRWRARRDAALQSGAHLVTTDFADPRNHWVDMGSRLAARCNPVAASARCLGGQLAALEQALWLAHIRLAPEVP